MTRYTNSLYLRLIALDFRRSLCWRIRELGLHKDLLHMVIALIEHVIDDIQFFHEHTVSQHDVGVCLAFLNVLEKFLPVKVDGGLAVTDEADAALHYGTNVEVVGLLRKRDVRKVEQVMENGEIGVGEHTYPT